MSCTGKIRLLSISKMEINSSVEAFISSKITSEWQSCEEIFKVISGVVTKDQFETIIMGFVRKGAVEMKEEHEKCLIFNNGTDFRDYIGVRFNSEELKESPLLPENFKKEILFLFYYGGRMNYYRVLNLSGETLESSQRISEQCSLYRMITAGRHFDGLDIGNYRNRIDKVRGIIKAACQLEDDDFRKSYDITLKSASMPFGETHAETSKKAVDPAEEHFMLAVKYNHAKDFKKALSEITIAAYLNPGCREYSDLKNEITEKLKSERTDALFNAFEKNDSLLLHEEKLEKVISGIVELTESSSLAHLRLAKIALEKDMPVMAIQHAEEAIRKDPDLTGEAEKLIEKAHRKMKELNINPYNYNKDIYTIKKG